MRKLAIAVLAVPVLSVVYVSSALRRSLLARTGLAITLGAVVALGVISTVRPAPAAAVPPSVRLPLTDATFRTVVATDRALADPVTIEFSSPMDAGSVAASLKIEPPTAVRLGWDGAGRVLTITPTAHWAPGTLHSITVDAGALATNGVPMVSPERAAFLTRGVTNGAISASAPLGKRIALGSSFVLTFDGPVDVDDLASSLAIDPAIEGTLIRTASLADGTTFRYTPTAPLIAGTTYRIAVEGLTDADGVAVDPLSVALKTAAVPGVVRFRPLDATTRVSRDQVLSVRFTKPMDRASTKAAFKVRADGKPVAGSISFAEGDTVLVFDPTKLLPFSSKIVITVAASAASKDGAEMGRAATAVVRTIAKPSVAPATSGGGDGGDDGGGGGGGGGGAVGGGSWASVETYYLGLMNCTRTGGTVTSTGRCSSPGGRDVAPLKLDAGISSKVARPYAKRLADGADCSHFIGGNPGDRLRRAGYTNYVWAENLGCRSGNPKAAVLGSHRYFQSEKSYNGGHYVNLMNAKYDRVGIGVWVTNGRVRLVVDFYHP